MFSNLRPLRCIVLMGCARRAQLRFRWSALLVLLCFFVRFGKGSCSGTCLKLQAAEWNLGLTSSLILSLQGIGQKGLRTRQATERTRIGAATGAAPRRGWLWITEWSSSPCSAWKSKREYAQAEKLPRLAESSSCPVLINGSINIYTWTSKCLKNIVPTIYAKS